MKAQQVFETVTNQLIADIEAGAGQWRMPWHALATIGTPESIDGRRYRGMNAIWLPLVATVHDWTAGIWATYPAWQRHGAQVRRGEKGTPVVFWTETTRRANPSADEDANDEEHPRTGRRRWFARGYTVFAGEQVDGAAEIIERRTARRLGHPAPQRIEAAEAYFAALGAKVTQHGNRAYYSPATDSITVPPLARFDDAQHFYSTLAHEHVHWTGHPERCAREFGERFGDDAYAAEELVAELGAAMWSAQADIAQATRKDHAAYLASWLRILRANPRHLLTVASKAQAAVDWMNSRAGTTDRQTTDNTA